ncbi:glycosyltransferase [Rhodoplanes sp. TEM]|uniref:Glycosyltransferase n=1 Tax=Rhodoplanes tepidamans TaxID=200616 RepID=A0ABT5JAN9_RHOTP|nr:MULTISPECIES: glycosyltransferase [Rhodoplanes]MDC7786707.1 glycosyltransferase [Rhodoplanes tepidamans]MDC7983713.1 glycosyltransferase [Rhodoplanes sp. TEM]MDQ0358143.1 GT2 family glycosyltransferase [Rhodoplanes tepidamans]
MAARALGEGDDAGAFAFADRRCRIAPAPQAHSFLLRAEAAHRLGLGAWAIADCRRALELAPDNVAACRRMLAWSSGPEQCRAARRLLAQDEDLDVLRKALAIVWASGDRSFATVAVLDDAIRGWAAWRCDAPLEIAVRDDAGGEMTVSLPADPFHRLSDAETRAVVFDLARPPSPAPQTILLSLRGEPVHAVRAAATSVSRRPAGLARPRPEEARPSLRVFAGETRPTVVIVPVYKDFEATRLCLDQLLPELGGPVRAVVVNDASPDPRIRKHLAAIAAAPSLELVENACNLGFVGAVNRVLERIVDEDVVLLNADTVVPPGFLDRLAAAAYAAPGIGTAMPLSNNGEFASFPVPNEVNPLPAVEEILRLDALAAEANGGVVVDVPSGIGFCLYVTAACARAVGPLHDRFHRGYLEDVDYCLRARALGFRNVCVPSVFVGHAGSRSFQEEKRSLVLRNLDILDTRFPFYRAECLAFVEADPLRGARGRLEAAALDATHPVVIVGGGGALGEIARARGRRALAAGESALVLTVAPSRRGTVAALAHPADALPQSLRFGLDTEDGRAALDALLRRLRPARIEIVDIRAVSQGLLDLITTLGAPLDVVVADGTLRHMAECREVVARAARIVAPDADAERFAQRLVDRPVVRDPVRRSAAEAAASVPPVLRPRSAPDDASTAAPRLGIVSGRGDAGEYRLLRAVADVLRRTAPAARIVVLGGTLDDIGLLRLGTVFVTGPVTPDELDRMIEAHRLTHVLAGIGAPLFGHPLIARARTAARPVAFPDWSEAAVAARGGDLPLDPRLPDDAVAERLRDWMMP